MIFGTHDENTLAQFEEIKQGASHAALMADGHLGYHFPIGGVAAYRNKIPIAGVGFDIACGNCAIKTDLDIYSSLLFVDEIKQSLASDIWKNISFGIGRKNTCDDAPVDHPLFTDQRWDIIPVEHRESLRDKARAQLGTVGSGNHYVDVFCDLKDKNIWVGVHFGSRGFGHTIASNFLALSDNRKWGDRAPEHLGMVSLDDQIGQDYLALMELAGEYAYAGREWVASKVVGMLGGVEVDKVHNHHNFAWKERHFGEDVIVVRKGATPAFPGQRGFVGGSMGDTSVILEGSNQNSINQIFALFSTVHGAGRIMSRTEAKGKKNKKGEVIKEPAISYGDMYTWISKMKVALRGGGVDEAPQAYRRLPDVIQSQWDTITVTDILHPIIVVMAGEGEHDPYKD